MQPISPFRVFALILGVFTLLLQLSLYFPKEGIVIVEDKLKLKFPGLIDFLYYTPQEYKEIDDIIADVDTTLDEIPADTLIKHQNDTTGKLGNPSDTSTLNLDASKIKFLEFGDKKPEEVLHPFFAKLAGLSSSKKIVRIIHYGDSQIEGDRMTAYIRQKLQAKFGGNGPGMIPAYNQYNTLSFVQTLSSNFKRYTAFADVSKDVKHKKYGSMASLARFTKIVADTLIPLQEETEGWIEIGYGKQAFGNARQFNRVRLFYGNCKSPVFMQVTNNGEVIHEDSLIADGNMHSIELSFASTPEKLRYTFKGKDSPDFYGFSLDGNFGVAVDNVAMRGSSGTFLNKVDQSLMGRMYSELGVELFIMQFGGNVMPYLEDEKEAKEYANYFYSQLVALKRIRPGACVVVIGPSDMSLKDEGEWKTYPMLPYVVDELKAASFKAGAAYWDMFAAMGGENSMPTWVEKGLAVEDYTHFSPGGARFVAEMFYEAFMYEYQKYTKKGEKEK
ncbi:MAG: hypothetical protein ACOZCO_00810 [Bacteroidota bacterium]